MFTYISLAIIVIAMVFAIATKLSNAPASANLQQGGFSAKAKRLKMAREAAIAKQKQDDDPYAWIRPMIIVDFFRKFWITR
jgi:hypothetical protein